MSKFTIKRRQIATAHGADICQERRLHAVEAIALSILRPDMSPVYQFQKPAQLNDQYQRRLRAHGIRLEGHSITPRPDRNPARAYLNPLPQITSHNDIVQRLEAYKKRFAARGSGGRMYATLDT